MKTTLAGTDFMAAGPWYTYNDTPGDIAMAHFSIQRDLGPNGSAIYLRVGDAGDYVAVRFLPFPLLGCRLPYARITGRRGGRMTILEGWGIHYLPGRGWTYDFWGWGCVVLRLGAKTVRIGTDDGEGLLAVMQAKTPSRTT